MEKHQTPHTCTCCGNRFDLGKTWRCPRCFKSVITTGSCGGACGKCKSGSCQK